MKLKFFFFILIITFAQLSAQKKELLEEAMAMFEGSDDKTLWLKDYSGYLDGTHKVRMVIVTDDEKFKGAYEYLSSGARFSLEGRIRW